jgi:F-type H+-transporting ATPase subunit b
MLKFDFNALWTLINLLFFFVLMRLFLFKPIKKVLDARKEMIDNQFKEAEEKENAAQEMKSDMEKRLAGAEEEKKAIIVNARNDARAEYDKILGRAQKEAQRIKDDAKRASDIETEKARLAVREDIAALAMATAEKVVGEVASQQIDSDLYDKFLDESSDD